MRSKIVCGFITAMFLATAVYAYADQAKLATSTPDGLPVASRPADTAAQAGAANPELHRRNPRYQLCRDDVLVLDFTLTPEFNQTVTGQPDGYITLLGVGDLHAEGQTVPEVTQSVRAAYAKTVHNPILTVRLIEFEKPYFIVGGEVGHPGKFDLRGDTSATEAVAIAGGLKDSAKHSQVVLFHRVPDGWAQVKKLNMKKMLKEGNLDEDAYLQPGDFLYVPKNTISKIAKFIPTSSVGMYTNPLQH